MSDNNQVFFTVFDDDNNIRWSGTCPASDMAKQGVAAGLHVTYGDQDVQIAMVLSNSIGNGPTHKIEITVDGIFYVPVDPEAPAVVLSTILVESVEAEPVQIVKAEVR